MSKQRQLTAKTTRWKETTAITGFLAVLSLIGGNARAQDAATQCWQIISPAVQGIDPLAMVMLNRCTGKTWLLAKVTVREGRSDASSPMYVYRWRPITIDNEGEAAMPMRQSTPR